MATMNNGTGDGSRDDDDGFTHIAENYDNSGYGGDDENLAQSVVDEVVNNGLIDGQATTANHNPYFPEPHASKLTALASSAKNNRIKNKQHRSSSSYNGLRYYHAHAAATAAPPPPATAKPPSSKTVGFETKHSPSHTHHNNPPAHPPRDVNATNHENAVPYEPKLPHQAGLTMQPPQPGQPLVAFAPMAPPAVPVAMGPPAAMAPMPMGPPMGPMPPWGFPPMPPPGMVVPMPPPPGIMAPPNFMMPPGMPPMAPLMAPPMQPLMMPMPGMMPPPPPSMNGNGMIPPLMPAMMPPPGAVPGFSMQLPAAQQHVQSQHQPTQSDQLVQPTQLPVQPTPSVLPIQTIRSNKTSNNQQPQDLPSPPSYASTPNQTGTTVAPPHSSANSTTDPSSSSTKSKTTNATTKNATKNNDNAHETSSLLQKAIASQKVIVSQSQPTLRATYVYENIYKNHLPANTATSSITHHGAHHQHPLTTNATATDSIARHGAHQHHLPTNNTATTNNNDNTNTSTSSRNNTDNPIISKNNDSTTAAATTTNKNNNGISSKGKVIVQQGVTYHIPHTSIQYNPRHPHFKCTLSYHKFHPTHKYLFRYDDAGDLDETAVGSSRSAGSNDGRRSGVEGGGHGVSSTNYGHWIPCDECPPGATEEDIKYRFDKCQYREFLKESRQWGSGGDHTEGETGVRSRGGELLIPPDKDDGEKGSSSTSKADSSSSGKRQKQSSNGRGSAKKKMSKQKRKPVKESTRAQTLHDSSESPQSPHADDLSRESHQHQKQQHWLESWRYSNLPQWPVQHQSYPPQQNRQEEEVLSKEENDGNEEDGTVSPPMKKIKTVRLSQAQCNQINVGNGNHNIDSASTGGTINYLYGQNHSAGENNDVTTSNTNDDTVGDEGQEEENDSITYTAEGHVEV